jgi:hypothetical protein
MKNLKSFYFALFDKYWIGIVTALVVATFVVRFLVWWLFEVYNSAYLVNNGGLIDSYLVPRLSVVPWQVDWSYGPFTYLLYWLISHASNAALFARVINFLADSISTYLVAAVGGRFLSKSKSLVAAACWAFAPPTIWGSVFGLVDSVPILATLGSVYLALSGRTRLAIFVVGAGFALKWYPIFILPLILRAHLSKQDRFKLVLFSLYPFALTGLLLIVNSYISGVTLTNELGLTLHNFSSRMPAGPSIWNLFLAIDHSQSILKPISVSIIYSLMLAAFLIVGLRSPVNSGLRFLRSSTNIIFVLVNISSQIQGNYLLWSYPLILIVILKEQIRRILFLKISVLVSGFVFDYLFIYPRLGNIAQGPLALIASPSTYDIFTIGAYQASVWVLFYLLTNRKALLCA